MKECSIVPRKGNQCVTCYTGFHGMCVGSPYHRFLLSLTEPGDDKSIIHPAAESIVFTHNGLCGDVSVRR